MGNLAKPIETKKIIEKYDFFFKKKFGQNFLIDENVVRKIVKSSGISKEDTVLEIGPGIGTMTQILCEEAKKVVCVEIDTTLIKILEETLSSYDNVFVINDDILKCNLLKLSEEYNESKPFCVVANLPYYITTPIIMGLLEANAKNGNILKSINVMLQKEVADRICAKPKTKDYGALTLAINYYTEAKITMNVSANCFMPRPNVESSIISLKIRPYKEKVEDENLLFNIIRAGFSKRRKTFINSVSSTTNFTKEEIEKALLNFGFSLNIRGEDLSLDDYINISKQLEKEKTCFH